MTTSWAGCTESVGWQWLPNVIMGGFSVSPAFQLLPPPLQTRLLSLFPFFAWSVVALEIPSVCRLWLYVPKQVAEDCG